MEFDDLIKSAKSVYGSRQIARNAWAGSVCIDVCSGMGFCAEHAAIAAMITVGESRIMKMVAIGGNGIYPPCGRCREFVNQINDKNMDTEVMVSQDKIVKLKELIPFDYESVKSE